MRTRPALARPIGLICLALFVFATQDRGGAQQERARAPKVVLISLDGAGSAMTEELLRRGVLPRRTGLDRLRRLGVSATRHIPATPSLTFVSHVAMATGSISARNNISSNAMHPVAAPIATNMNGSLAPIGGYQLEPLGPASSLTAEPLWVTLRNAGRSAITATWVGAEGGDIRIGNALVQAAMPTRVASYSVPFPIPGGAPARGFALTSSDFTTADATLTEQLTRAGRTSYSPVRITATPIEVLFCAPDGAGTCGTTNEAGRSLRYDLTLAALDTTNNRKPDYDTLVVFDRTRGVLPGPFTLPATGPAYVRLRTTSAPFYFEGSGGRVATRFFVTTLAADLSTVRLARYSATYLPRNAAVLRFIDEITAHVGVPPADPEFRITERLSPGFTSFTDPEVEGIYQDQVTTFLDYSTQMALHAIEQNPGVDLAMIYIDQPDASSHQFLLTDSRQASNPTDGRTIGSRGNPSGAAGQDSGKVLRYRRYVEHAYTIANNIVEQVIQRVGTDRDGRPLSDVIVVSDHGLAAFHTAVDLRALLTTAGIDTRRLNVRASGAVANIYVDLAGRESGGVVSASEYTALVERVAGELRAMRDPNAVFNPTGQTLFSDVWTRPTGCGRPGFCMDEHIGQDTGDVLALLREGYNLDGTQSPPVPRLNDSKAAGFSVPNFYGTHGHNSDLQSMSAIFYAAGPSFRRDTRLSAVRGIDVAPTVLRILGVQPPATADGRAIEEALVQRAERRP